MHRFSIWQQLMAKGNSVLASRKTRGAKNNSPNVGNLPGAMAVAYAAGKTVESLENRQMMNAVTSFTLINADTDKDIMTLSNGSTINLANLPTRNLNVRANVGGTVESIRFALDSNSNFRTESSAPYALAGDADGDYVSWSPGLGSHTMKATPFSADNASGAVGTPLQVSFNVTSNKTTTTTTPGGSTTGALTAPTYLIGDAVSAGHVDLAWEDKSNNESKFDILRSTDGVNFPVIDSVGAGETTYTDTSTTGGKTYYYKVRAANTTDRSVPSNVATIKTPASTTTTVTVPDSPSALAATAGSSTQVGLKWYDHSGNESGFRVLRSTDGSNFAQVATVGANDVDYTDASVAAGKKYYYRVFAYNSAGNSSSYAGDDVTTPTSTTTTTTTAPVSAPAESIDGGISAGSLGSIPQSVVNSAIAEPLVRYSRYIAGGAHTNQTHDGHSPTVLALAAFQGNTSADSRLLTQVRYSITGGNEITATGGYPAQHERHVTAMFSIVKMTPRIWNQLTTTEKKKIDLVMKAAFVASAFTTGDSNPFILAGAKQYALDGDGNLGRDYNPNYREGMIGGVLVGMVYFGGPATANSILANYDHDDFVAELKSYGLTNLAQTFSWKNDNPTSGAPSGSAIEKAMRAGYKYFGLGLTQYMDIYGKLATNTFGKAVNAGLNAGAGYNGYGKIVSGADALPNKGAVGMLTEFDSFDANGPRSSASYAYDGFRTHEANHLVLVMGGYWQEDHAAATTAISRLKVGITDLWYKLERGYLNYAKGTGAGETSLTSSDRGYAYTKSLWSDVLKPFHSL